MAMNVITSGSHRAYGALRLRFANENWFLMAGFLFFCSPILRH